MLARAARTPLCISRLAHGSSSLARRRMCSTRASFSLEQEERTNWPLVAGGMLAAGVLVSGLLVKRERVLWRLQSSVDANTAMGGLMGQETSTRQVAGLMIAFALAQLPVDELKLKLLKGGGLQRWGERVDVGERWRKCVVWGGWCEPLAWSALEILAASPDRDRSRLPSKRSRANTMREVLRTFQNRLISPRRLVGCFDLDVQQIALGALNALLEGDAALEAGHRSSEWSRDHCMHARLATPR